MEWFCTYLELEQETVYVCYDQAMCRGNHITDLLPFYGTFILSTPSSVMFLVPCGRNMEEQECGGSGSFYIDILTVHKHSHSCLLLTMNSHTLSAFKDDFWWMKIYFICMCSFGWLSLLIRWLHTHKHMDNTIWICWAIKREHEFGKKCVGRDKEKKL